MDKHGYLKWISLTLNGQTSEQMFLRNTVFFKILFYVWDAYFKVT